MSDANTKLLMHFNGDFLDYSGSNHHPNTHGHFSFPAGKFSTGFKSNFGKLFVPDHSDFNFGSSDFTVDAWCYVGSSGSSGQYLFSIGSREVAVYFYRSYRRVYLYLDGLSGYSSDDIFPLDTWFHFALVRSGSTFTVYIDGQSAYTRIYASDVTGGDLEIGSYNYTIQIEAIDEFRISDIARWSSGFTPPTAAYTDGAVTPPTFDDSPDFLLHFNESYLDCFGETPQLNGCYGFEDGQFDKAFRSKYGNLIFKNADALKFGTGDFTVDFRAKFDLSGSSYYIFDNGVPTSTDYLRMSLSSSELRFYCGTSTVQYTVNANIALATWYHIAIVRAGNRVLVYVDGILKLNFVNTSNLNVAGDLYIGCAKNSEASYFRGLIDEFCVTNGCAKWVTDFTSPATEYPGTTPADPAEPTSDFLLHFNESFLDCFGETPQFNGYYGFEDGRFDKAFRSKYGNLIFENADALKFGTEDFTVDFRAKFELSGSSYYIYDNGVPTSTDYFRMSLSGTELRFYCGSSTALYTVNANIALDAWYHIAIVRVGRALLIFVNGNLRYNSINLTNINSPGDLYIGSAKGSESSYFRGLIDEFRVIKGYAKWVTEFTPPDSEYAGTTPADPPVETDCDLLLHFDNACFDSSGQNHPVVESDYFEFDEDGKYNQQALFDGSKYLIAGDLADWSLDADFTIDFWMYLPTGYSTGRYIFSLGYRRFSLMTHSSNALRLYVNGSNIYLPDNCVQSDTWQHIAVTCVGRVMLIFVDGQAVDMRLLTGTMEPTTDLFIGSDSLAGIFDGRIDEFRIVKGRCDWFMDFTPPSNAYADPVITAPPTSIPIKKWPDGYTFKPEVEFAWLESFQADRYELQITRTSDGYTETFSDLLETSYVHILQTDQYTWRIRAGNSFGYGTWSDYGNIEKRDVILNNPLAGVTTGFSETLFVLVDFQLYELHFHDTDVENSEGWKDQANYVRVYYHVSYGWIIVIGVSASYTIQSWNLNNGTDGLAGFNYDWLYNYNRTYIYFATTARLATNPPVAQNGTCPLLAFDWDFTRHPEGKQITDDTSASLSRSHFWKIRLLGGTEYTFENLPTAGGMTSSYLNLYDRDGKTVLASSNGFIGGIYASITHTIASTGSYYIEQEGNYTIYNYDYTGPYLLQSDPAPMPGVFAMNPGRNAARTQTENHHHFKYEIERFLNFANSPARFTVNVYRNAKNIIRYDILSCKYSNQLSGFAARAKTASNNIGQYDLRSRERASDMPVLNNSFVNPGWSIHAKNVETGQVLDLGFIPIDTPPVDRKLEGVSLAEGVWEVEVRLHQWYWSHCRWRKITTLVVGDDQIEQESFSVIHNLRHLVEHFRAVLRWEVVDERNPRYQHFAIWFSETTPVDTINVPADMLLHVPSSGTYKYDFAQDKPIYAAVAAINPEGSENGPVSEIYCPWSLIAPVSPPNQQAILR